MLFRVSIAAIFLITQLSLSWASGMLMDAEMNMGAGKADGVVHVHAETGDVVADSEVYLTAHESHDDCDCNVDCQLCALTLPSVVQLLVEATPMFEPSAVPRSMPPGTTAHPYRPPANS